MPLEHAAQFEVVGLGADAVDYLDAWELQRRVHADGRGRRARPTRSCCSSTRRPTPPASAPSRTSGPLDPGGAPVIDVDRGGKITFHGPGQIVAYPIVRLPEHVLVVDFVRRLEEAMIATCADFGVATARVPGRSGVWLRADERGPERKIAAIGLRVSRGRDDARHRPQLRRGPRRGTTGSSRAASPTPGSPRCPRSWAGTSP